MSNIITNVSAPNTSPENRNPHFEKLFYEIICTPSSDKTQLEVVLEIEVGEKDNEKPTSVIGGTKFFAVVSPGGGSTELKRLRTLPDKTKWIYQNTISSSTFANPGEYTIIIQGINPSPDNKTHRKLGDVLVEVNDASVETITSVRLTRADSGPSLNNDQQLWQAIKAHSLNFDQYSDFMDDIICNPMEGYRNEREAMKKRSPFVKSDEYNLIKFGTEFFMLFNFGVSAFEMKNYVGTSGKLPYYDFVIKRIKDQLTLDALTVNSNGQPAVGSNNQLKTFLNTDCGEREYERIFTPFMVELIWNYWMEQGMLVQTLNVINLRFQNIKGTRYRDPLMRFNADPLRPLSHILWGYIQDEQHRLSIPRRVNEYDHEYGLSLTGTAVPRVFGADTRVKFLETFHTLLTMCTIYFKEADDTTRIADAFPILNALKEVHLQLAEGNHNAYGNLTWTARQEMLMQQYILARAEMREFLGGRVMVPYQEPWMDRVDTMRSIQGWGGTSIVYYYELAVHGELILLSIRYGNWSDVTLDRQNAANWAQEFRNSIQRYIHAYRTVTGVDLAVEQVIQLPNTFAIQPSFLIQQKLLLEERSRRRA